MGVLAAFLAGLSVGVACESGTAASPFGAEAGSALGDGSAQTCNQLAMPDGGRVHVTGTVTQAIHDAGAPVKPIANAMVARRSRAGFRPAVEYGGLYVPWCDLGQASPYYVFGALSDDAGRFEIDVKEGSLGFHSFANDYLYTRAPLDTATGRTVVLEMEPLPKGQAQPTFADAHFDKTTVAPGEPVTFSATIATWDSGAARAPSDPLSDENIIVEPTNSWGVELNPPASGQKDDFPDGLWKRTFPAPNAPGTYTYWFSATTSQCITSKLVSMTLKVECDGGRC
jgi:hypothetical protein